MVKFGLRIPEFAVDGSRATELIDQGGRALTAGRGRFASAWVSDHFLPWNAFGGVNIPNLESWTAVTYLAAQHPDYTFGQIVLSQSYRPPALLAKMAATLQTFTGGRFVLGLGAGWKEDEYRAYGYEFPPAAIRIQQLAEAAQILKLMWTEPAATFHGRHYHIDNAVCEPRPQPAIPLLIGGSGRQLTLRVVARYADWWNGGGTAAQYAETLAALRGHCRDVGRDYDTVVKTWVGDCVAVAATSAAAQTIAAASPFYDRESAIVGNPAEVTAQLRRLVDLGVEHFILRFADFPRTEGITLFGQEVIGAF